MPVCELNEKNKIRGINYSVHFSFNLYKMPRFYQLPYVYSKKRVDRFQVREYHWLRQWVISPVAPNYRLGGSREQQSECLTGLAWATLLVKLFIPFRMRSTDRLGPSSNHYLPWRKVHTEACVLRENKTHDPTAIFLDPDRTPGSQYFKPNLSCLLRNNKQAIPISYSYLWYANSIKMKTFLFIFFGVITWPCTIFWG